MDTTFKNKKIEKLIIDTKCVSSLKTHQNYFFILLFFIFFVKNHWIKTIKDIFTSTIDKIKRYFEGIFF